MLLREIELPLTSPPWDPVWQAAPCGCACSAPSLGGGGGGGSRSRKGGPHVREDHRPTCALSRVWGPRCLAQGHLPGEAMRLREGRQLHCVAADVPALWLPWWVPRPCPPAPSLRAQQRRAPGAWDRAAWLHCLEACFQEAHAEPLIRHAGDGIRLWLLCLHRQSMRAQHCTRLMEQGTAAPRTARGWPHGATPLGPSG